MSTSVETQQPGGIALGFAATVVRLRYVVAVFWVAATVAAVSFLPNLEQADAGALGALAPENADAVAAEVRSFELFNFPLLSRALVVQRDPDGLSAVDQARVFQRVVDLNQGEFEDLPNVRGGLAVTNALGEPPFSRESSTTALTYLFIEPDLGFQERTAAAQRFADRRIGQPPGQFVGVTGAAPARAEQVGRIQDALPLVELATLLLVTMTVGIHFRAVGAPLITIAAVGVSYLVSIRVIGFIGHRAGIAVPREVEPVIVVLLFGVITDYSIFFLSRARQRLGDRVDAHDAVERGTAELVPTIVTAGLTVVGASASLLVAELGFFRAFGPGMAMAVLIGLVVAITLVPALLAIGGSLTFWPRRPRPEDADTDDEPRTRATTLATRRPLLTTVACVAVLLVPASGVLFIEVGNTLIRGLPDDAGPNVAYRQATQGFAAGILSPTVIMLEAPGIAGERAKLRRLQRFVERQPGVAETLGPREQPLEREFGAVFSPSGNAARMIVVLNADPLGAAGIRIIQRLRERIPLLLEDVGLEGARVSFIGDTALSQETVAKTRADLGRIAPVTLVVVFLVLAIFLRALVAPIYLVAASVLALLASLGLTAYVFQTLLGHGELTFYVPFAAAVLLVALGSDYNIFLVGRVWSAARRRPLRDAVRVAGARAARPITVAAFVLAVSFAALAIVPLRPFRELAFAMAAGLVIDAFVVRTLLVPALISLVGERSAWPSGRMARAAPVAGADPAPAD